MPNSEAFHVSGGFTTHNLCHLDKRAEHCFVPHFWKRNLLDQTIPPRVMTAQTLIQSAANADLI